MGQVLVHGCRAQALPQEAPRVAAQARPGGRARPLPAEAGLVLPLGQRDGHIVAPPAPGLARAADRATPSRHETLLAERAVAPLSLSGGLDGRRIGYLVCAWGHGSYGATRVSGRPGCAVSELARWPTRVCAVPHRAYCRLHVTLFTRVQYKISADFLPSARRHWLSPCVGLRL